MSRTTIIMAIVDSDDVTKDSEILDLATRLGNALERRGRKAVLTVASRWETKGGPAQVGIEAAMDQADEVLKRMVEDALKKKPEQGGT